MIIRVKDWETLTSIRVPWHFKLEELFMWICERKDDVLITCGYEDRSYPSVHSVLPLRGLDIRSRIYMDPGKLCSQINAAWSYDPVRPLKPCALYHNTGRGNHIHLQVCTETTKI